MQYWVLWQSWYTGGYDKARLLSTAFAEKVKRISGIDVSAGYDIVSFEEDASVQYDPFIEVKSFADQPHFYSSKLKLQRYMVINTTYT